MSNYPTKSKIDAWDLENNIVFLRADLNVNLTELATKEPQKLIALQPTLDLLLKKKAKILLATHLGRPEHQDEKYSTKQLQNRLQKNGSKVTFAKTPAEAYQMLQNGNNIVLLENLRFWPEEKQADENFARELKGISTYYVNDAFGTLHRNDTSISVLPLLYQDDKKSIGLLVENELKHLKKLKDEPEKPFTIILGGGKPQDKIPLIRGLLDNASTIILCPALCFTFMQALGKKVGCSLVANELMPMALEILALAEKKGVKILMPEDFIVAENTFHGKIENVMADAFPENGVGIATGFKTLEKLEPIIQTSKTIFLNAAMGNLDRPETMVPLERLLYQVAQSPYYTVIGGGDSVAAANFYNLTTKFSFCSTGGGATLSYLSGQKLPGLEALR